MSLKIYNRIPKGSKFTIIIGDFNTPLPIIDRKIDTRSVKGRNLNCTISQHDPISIYTIFLPTAEHITLGTQDTINKIDYILDHETSLSKSLKDASHT